MLFCLDLVSTATQTAATDTAEAHTVHLAEVDLAIDQAGELVEEAAVDTAAADTEPAVPETAAEREDRKMRENRRDVEACLDHTGRNHFQME